MPLLRMLTAGESHGAGLVVIIEGVPAGLKIEAGHVNYELQRRQQGFGRGGRMQIEKDEAEFIAGLRGGVTTGAPLALLIRNRDWDNWREFMHPLYPPAADYQPVTAPRPGHADLAGALKYAHRDLRNVLERASARETAARVAAGAVARILLSEVGVEIAAWVSRIGNVNLPVEVEQEMWRRSPREIRELCQLSPVLCPHPAQSDAMCQQIEEAAACGDTVGGVFTILAAGLVPGLGSYVHYDRRLDARLAAAVMSIPGIKGVEVGLGFAAAALTGSQVHDEIFYDPERGIYRLTNRAGGLEGGVTNGEPLIVRAAMKPIPTLRRALRSVDLNTKQPVDATRERSDVCAVPAASVVGEAMVAWELAQAYVEKFGGDTLADLQESVASYRKRIAR